MGMHGIGTGCECTISYAMNSTRSSVSTGAIGDSMLVSTAACLDHNQIRLD